MNEKNKWRNTPHKFIKTYAFVWHPIDCWCEMGFPFPEWISEKDGYEEMQMEMGEAELFAELTGRHLKW